MRIWLEASRELLPPLEKGRDGWGSQPPPDRQPKSALADFGGYSLGQGGNIRLGRVDLPLSGGGVRRQPPSKCDFPAAGMSHPCELMRRMLFEIPRDPPRTGRVA